MGAGIVLDTSFLITLADPGRANHASAIRYWRHFMEERLPVFLPTIVVSEFCVRQPIPPEILRACIILPFNWDDAIKTAELNFKPFKTDGESRAAVKDDMKIIAQAVICDAQHMISEDAETLLRYVTSLREAGKISIRSICLRDGFDRSFFDVNGQSDFHDAFDGSETEANRP